LEKLSSVVQSVAETEYSNTKLSKEMLINFCNSKQQATATHSHTAALSSAGVAFTATLQI
jgi:hypothetical protein